MKRIQLFLTLITCALLCQSAHAVIWKSSQIVGYNTGNLGATGVGDTDGWNPGTATPNVTVTNGSGSLIGTNLGLVASAGDRVFLNETNSLAARIQFVPNSTFPQANDTNIYYSFLCKFNNASNVGEGEALVRVNRANSGAGTPQHWDLVARNNGSGQIQLGLFKANGITNYAATNISVGQTVFVVVRQHIIPAAQNDVYDLWVNPPSEFYGTNEANIPPVQATVGSVTTDGTEDSSGTGPGRLTLGSGASSEFDELRVASTWADATPRFGSCVGAAVEANPVSVTQSAEISASFLAQALSTATSPTYQWQRSTNGGSAWFNISGATAARYTTPSLSISESGSQYRAIISVACNGSSATSTVASVTLTNPVVSSTGIVMNDTFTDPDLGFDDRSNPPLTSTNSLWYTATTDNLTAFGQGGNMLATPLPGSSSLWLGYFTDTNASPVHLGVGRSIRVTLPFTPNSYSSFTNNSGVRMGLFDYYDGGTRIIQDGANAGGSQGSGTGVRGYMLNLDFGPTFSANSPVQLLARNVLTDINLMGSIGDYESFGSGPAGGGYVGATAFQAGTQYTLVFTATRTAVNTVNLTATITGGGTNWSHSITDTNYAYHRFDSFGIRPNSLETSADSFTYSEFVVEVLASAIPVSPFSITAVQSLSPTSVKLTWASETGATYHILSSDSLSTPNWVTNGTVVATGSSTSYTNSPTTVAERFYRVLGLPYTP